MDKNTTIIGCLHHRPSPRNHPRPSAATEVLPSFPIKMEHVTKALVKVPITTAVENAGAEGTFGFDGVNGVKSVYEEDVTVNDDDAECGEDYITCSKVHKLLHGVACERFVSRMTFNSMKEFQEVITKYAEDAKVSVNVEIREPFWIKFHCKGKDCKWMISASHNFNKRNFKVETYLPKHTCYSDDSNKKLLFVHVSAHGHEKVYNVEGFDGGIMAAGGDYEDVIVVDDDELVDDDSDYYFESSDMGTDFEGSETDEIYRRSSRVYRLGRGVGSEKFILRMTFDNRKRFREVINRYIDETRLPIRVEINEPNMIKFVCKGKGCRWMIYAGKDIGSKVFKVKTYIPKHTCSSDNTNKAVVTSSFIASYFMSKISSQPEITYRQIQELCLTELNADVSLYKCKRAKSIVKQMIDDNIMYGEKVHPNNPSSSTVVSENSSDNSIASNSSQVRQARKKRRQTHMSEYKSSSSSSD